MLYQAGQEKNTEIQLLSGPVHFIFSCSHYNITVTLGNESTDRLLEVDHLIEVLKMQYKILMAKMEL